MSYLVFNSAVYGKVKSISVDSTECGKVVFVIESASKRVSLDCCISDADADRLEAWLRERKKPQPRRPDEVGVWRVWSAGEETWHYSTIRVEDRNGELWYTRDGGTKLHINNLRSDIVGVRLGDLPSEEPANDAQQKPTTLNVLSALHAAVRDINAHLKERFARSDRPRMEEVEKHLVRAGSMIAEMWERQQ